MNKYQEALDILSCLMSRKTEDDHTPFEYRKAQATLQELVDKATPKKPIMYKPRSVERPYCGFCNLRLKKSWIVCPRCATRIDWGDEE